MSPKSLLRHPAASSALSDFTDGGFQRIIPDQMNVDPSTVKRVLLCTGKVYYDLLAAREEKHYDDVAIIRIEQLYPMHKDELLDVLSVYPDGTPVVWVQEEARNMGAWAYMNRELPALLAGIFPWSCVSRPLSASPATGSMTRHKREQARADRRRLRQGERVAMALSLKVPTIGESISEATLGAWKHAEGDYVNVDEPLVEVESEKATFEVPSPGAGILRKILRKAGDTVSRGRGDRRDRAGGARARRRRRAVAAPRNGCAAPANGNGRAGGRGAGAAAARAAAGDGSPRGASAMRCARRPRRGDCWPRPAWRRRRSRGRAAAAASRPRTSCARSRSASTGTRGGRDARACAVLPSRRRRRSPCSTARASAWCRCRRCAGRSPSAWSRRRQTAAILTTFNEVDMSKVLALRERYQERFLKQHGVKLGFMSFFVKAAIEALRAFPSVNAEIRGTDVIYKDHYDIGVAVGGGKGLVVPVVRDADRLSFAELEKTIGDLAVRARDNKLMMKDLEGGTFTISNGGVYGSMLSTPILNPPQSGILGLHAIQKRPVAAGDQIVLRSMMYLALSYDHRLVDGREAVQFLVRIKECVEEPDRILLEI